MRSTPASEVNGSHGATYADRKVSLRRRQTDGSPLCLASLILATASSWLPPPPHHYNTDCYQERLAAARGGPRMGCSVRSANFRRFQHLLRSGGVFVRGHHHHPRNPGKRDSRTSHERYQVPPIRQRTLQYWVWIATIAFVSGMLSQSRSAQRLSVYANWSTLPAGERSPP